MNSIFKKNTILYLGIKNLFYSLLPVLVTFFVILLSFLFFDIYSISSNEKKIVWWISFLFFYFFYLFLLLLIELKEYGKNLFALNVVNFVFSMFVSIIIIFIIEQIVSLDKKIADSIDNPVLFSDYLFFVFFELFFFILLFIIFFFFINFLISSTLKGDRNLEFINKNILYFIFNDFKIKLKQGYLILFSKKIIFVIFFLEVNNKRDITFEYEIKNNEKTRNNKKNANTVTDFFEEFNNSKNVDEDDKVIIEDSDFVKDTKKLTNEFDIKNDNIINRYSILVYEDIDELNITGEESKNFYVLKNFELIKKIKILKKETKKLSKNKE